MKMHWKEEDGQRRRDGGCKTEKKKEKWMRKQWQCKSLCWACILLQNGNRKMHFHDSWWAFPLMVCKSLEHQTSYFYGLNGSWIAQMYKEGKKVLNDRKSHIKVIRGNRQGWMDESVRKVLIWRLVPVWQHVNSVYCNLIIWTPVP